MAVKFNHLEIVKDWYEGMSFLDILQMSMTAIHHGHLKILEFFMESMSFLDIGLVDEAIKYGHLDILKELMWERIDEHIYNKQEQGLDREIFSLDEILSAITNGHLDIADNICLKLIHMSK